MDEAEIATQRTHRAVGSPGGGRSGCAVAGRALERSALEIERPALQPPTQHEID
jgi:hypothetical protein